MLAVLVAVQTASRLCLVATALEADDGHFAASTILGISASVLWVIDRALTTAARNRREHRLTIEAMHHVLGGTTAFANARKEYEKILLGIFEWSRLEAQSRPALVADAIAAVVVLVVAFERGLIAPMLVFVTGMAIAYVALFAARRRIETRSRAVWDLRERYSQQVLDGLEASHELITSLPPGTYEERIGDSLKQHRQSTWILAFETLLLGRAPLLAGIAGAGVLVYFVVGIDRFHTVGQWALFASMIPPFGGLATASSWLVESKGPIDAVASLLNQPLRTYGDVVPKRLSPIKFDAVTVAYLSNVALRSVTVSVEGLVAIVGPNGSGKSTLLKTLVGLITPMEGSLTIGGADQTSIDWPKARTRIAYLPQKPYFPPGASVRESMRFLLGDVDDGSLRVTLEQVDVWNVLVTHVPSAGDPLDARIDALSAGERQRVALARVLARRADLFVLDEPDANLDREGIARLEEVLAKLAEKATVVFAAHDTELVRIAASTLHFERGTLIPS